MRSFRISGSSRVFADVNPPTHEQGTDKPGRAYASAGGSRRSGIEGTDWHDLEEHKFARDVAAALETAGARQQDQGAGDREPAAHLGRTAPCTPRGREEMHHRRAAQGLDPPSGARDREASGGMIERECPHPQ